jgi:hypothetical protein
LLLQLLAPGPVPAQAVRAGTIGTCIAAPAAAVRVPVAAGSFAAYLRALPLLPKGTPVLTYDGEPKYRQDVHAAVIDLSVGKKDLQQCADAVMRLRAEHLFAEGRYHAIRFNFTNGFAAPFSRWMRGERIKVSGNECSWVRSATADSSHATLLAYLEKVFTYAGTLSLSQELKSAGNLPIEAGDVFIQGGSPGHAVIVVDVAVLKDGRRTFLLAQSYMPAQQMHVLKNLERPERGAWYIAGEGDTLRTPEWTFRWSDRKRWS